MDVTRVRICASSFMICTYVSFENFLLSLVNDLAILYTSTYERLKIMAIITWWFVLVLCVMRTHTVVSILCKINSPIWRRCQFTGTFCWPFVPCEKFVMNSSIVRALGTLFFLLFFCKKNFVVVSGCKHSIWPPRGVRSRERRPVNPRLKKKKKKN